METLIKDLSLNDVTHVTTSSTFIGGIITTEQETSMQWPLIESFQRICYVIPVWCQSGDTTCCTTVEGIAGRGRRLSIVPASVQRSPVLQATHSCCAISA